MWLLDATELRLVEVPDERETVGAYVILSDTWEDDEATFHNMKPGPRNRYHRRKLDGFSKLKGACAQARKDGYRYIWVDTCCSAELSAAINSMYRWYANAAVCYACLADVAFDRDHENYAGFLREERRAIERRRWFTRGWTLQELNAPDKVVFYDCYWHTIGTKLNMAPLIAQITGVGEMVLRNRLTLPSFPTAVKMA